MPVRSGPVFRTIVVMGALDVDTAVVGRDGQFVGQVTRDWEIWGPNGGFLAALALRAAGAHTDLRRPASFSCHFLGVADFDAVDLSVRTLRRTKRAESIAVSMTQYGEPVLEAMVWVVGVTNAFNIVDIMDGLSSSQAAVERRAW